MAVHPRMTVHLGHQAKHLRSAPQQSFCVAAGSYGGISLVDIGSGNTRRVPGPATIRDIYPHPSREQIAFVDDEIGALSIVDFNGVHLFEHEVPDLRAAVSKCYRPGFECCYFDPNGNSLWTAARLQPEKLEIQLRETAGWSVVSAVTIEDPLGEADRAFFYDTCRPGMTALWLVAGQNGSRGYWITKGASGLEAELEPFLEDTGPPVFAPEGNEFLAFDEIRSICKFRFPTERKLGTCGSKWGEEDFFSEQLCYLDGRTALELTHHGRLFRIDVRQMKIANELALVGHEPRSRKHYYPSLADSETICTDISHFARLDRNIVFAYLREHGPEPTDWKESLVFCDVDSLLEGKDGGKKP